MPHLEALREAQIHLLNHPEEAFDPTLDRGRRIRAKSDSASDNRLSPRFWAAFVISGNWN